LAAWRISAAATASLSIMSRKPKRRRPSNAAHGRLAPAHGRGPTRGPISQPLRTSPSASAEPELGPRGLRVEKLGVSRRQALHYPSYSVKRSCTKALRASAHHAAVFGHECQEAPFVLVVKVPLNVLAEELLSKRDRGLFGIEPCVRTSRGCFFPARWSGDRACTRGEGERGSTAASALAWLVRAAAGIIRLRIKPCRCVIISVRPYPNALHGRAFTAAGR
jgi:hypothetical protein